MEKQDLKAYCIERDYFKLLSEWDREANGDLKPENVYPNSHRKVVWICGRGHKWQAEISTRVKGTGCPFCSGRKVQPGINDLQTVFPAVAKEFDLEKNAPLTPRDIMPGTLQKVWWKCRKGHSWKAEVASRTTNASGCPYCTKRAVLTGENDLATLYPELKEEWNTEKNGKLQPSRFSEKSNRVVWWKCSLGHEWAAAIRSRTDGNGCPVCGNRVLLSGFNDLQTRFPEVAKEWDTKKNGKPASMVLPNAQKAWWKCSKGHEWQTGISIRTLQGCGCPVCAGKQILPGFNDLASGFPEIAAEWNTEKNTELKPSEVSRTSNQRVWWKCSKGHEWRAPISSRTSKRTGCPYCSGHLVMAGFNDLATLDPVIAAQWDQILNGELTPSMVTCGSTKQVWWRCSEGHNWMAPVSRRTYYRSACPFCSGRYSMRKQNYYRDIVRQTLAARQQEIRLNDDAG